MQIQSYGAGIFTIADFLSAEECASFIERSEGRGYAGAGIRIEGEEHFLKEVRNNDRVIWDDPHLAGLLFERARSSLPAEIEGWKLAGLNERFRFYRYSEKQQFDWHLDGAVELVSGLESFLTFMIYLNDGYEGGRTEFGWESVAPVRGMALVFPHRRRHRGAPVLSGRKYVLRTDVMYEGADV